MGQARYLCRCHCCQHHGDIFQRCSYTLRLTASDSALSGSADLPLLVGGPLPSPWSDQDIGAVGTQGRGSFLTGTFIERGSGADIGGPLMRSTTFISHSTAMEQSLRALSLKKQRSFSKVGVMIRETLTAGSKYAAVVILPSTSISFERRTETNGPTPTPPRRVLSLSFPTGSS